MAYDEGLAERPRELFVDRPGVSEKKMFGGLAFMYRGHMLVGILGDSLMARVGPAEYADSLKRPHVREMDFTGKPMKGWVMVGKEGFKGDHELRAWLNQARKYVRTL